MLKGKRFYRLTCNFTFTEHLKIQAIKEIAIIWEYNVSINAIIASFVYYHPQTKFARIMLLHLSVSHSVHRGSTWSGTPPWAGTPPQDQVHTLGQVHPPGTRYTPPGQVHPQDQVPPPKLCMLGDTGNKRAVYIVVCKNVDLSFNIFIRLITSFRLFHSFWHLFELFLKIYFKGLSQ